VSKGGISFDSPDFDCPDIIRIPLYFISLLQHSLYKDTKNIFSSIPTAPWICHSSGDWF